MSEKTVLIRNASAIVTCDQHDTVFTNADIAIRGSEIVGIGPDVAGQGAGSARAADATEVIDARGKIVYPGMVNTHHHFFQSFVRNLVPIDYPSMAVLDWVGSIYEIFKHLTSDAIFYASYVAMADLLKHGCTCAFDHQYCFPRAAGPDLVDRQIEAATALGIRFHAGRGANTLPRSEGSTIPDEMLETTDEFIADCDRLIGAYHQPQRYAMHRIVVAPCQPINCYRETFVESLALARARGVSLHTHLGEGENPGMVARWGKRTLEWCEDMGFVGPDVWYAHGWELTGEECARLGQAHTGLSHCPAPAVLGGFDIIDVMDLDHHHVAVGLGCDGSATNDSSNLLDSLRLAYLMQARYAKARGSYARPYRMLKMATVGGAAVLGRDDLGCLEVGKAADLFMIDGDRLDLVGATHDPASLLAKTGYTADAWLTMVNGRVVFRDGALVGIDEPKIREQAAQVFQRDVASRHSVFDQQRNKEASIEGRMG